jgi:hypothetical protein
MQATAVKQVTGILHLLAVRTAATRMTGRSNG